MGPLVFKIQSERDGYEENEKITGRCQRIEEGTNEERTNEERKTEKRTTEKGKKDASEGTKVAYSFTKEI